MGRRSAWAEEYSYIGAVVGATYPEMGKVLREADAENLISWYRDMVHRVVKVQTLFISSMKTDLVQS